MQNLSDKLLTIIFKQIKKPLILLKLREICTKWFRLIDELFITSKLWQNLCFNGAVKPWIPVIMDKISPGIIKQYRSGIPQLFWRKIYMAYQKWRLYLGLPSFYTSQNLEFNLFMNDQNYKRCTCMDIFGDYVAIGTSKGTVSVYTKSMRFQKIYSQRFGNFAITELKFWFTDTKQLFLAILNWTANLTIWDVENRSIMTLLENDVELIISKAHRLFLITKSTGIVEYGWDGFRFFQESRLVERCTHTFHASLPHFVIAGMCIDHDKMTLLFNSSEYLMIISFKTSTRPNQSFEMIPDSLSIHAIEPTESIDYHCHIPITDVALVIDDSFLYVAVKNKLDEEYSWQTQPLGESVKGLVSSVLYYSNVLIFGLKTGKLLLYAFKNIQALLNINAKPIIVRTLFLADEPINNIFYCQTNGVSYIITTTDLQFYIFRLNDDFFSRSPMTQNNERRSIS